MKLREACSFIVNCYFKVLNNMTYSVTMFLFFVLGILYPRLSTYSDLLPSFLLYMQGCTGTRKTTTAMVMLNPFDFQMSSFEDSITSVVELFRQTPVGCFIIDDLKNLTVESRQILNKAIRLVGDVTTQSRKMRGGKVLDQNISALCSITGEIKLLLQESSIARVLILAYDKATVNLSKLNELQANKSKLCMAVLTIIQRFMNEENIIEKLCSAVIKNRHILNLQYQNIHGRYIDMMAWLEAMYDIISKYFAEAGINLDFDYKTGIETLIYNQYLSYKNDPVSVFANCLFGLYNSNGLAVYTESEFSAEKQADIVDYGAEWFIATGKVFNKIIQYSETIDCSVDFSEKVLRAELFSAGVLKQHNGKNTYELRKNGNRCSGFCIRKNRLQEYLKDSEEVNKNEFRS